MISAHILFDDAMTINDDDEVIPNDYVTLLVDCMEEAVRLVKITVSSL
jgi:hypothetical protein